MKTILYYKSATIFNAPIGNCGNLERHLNYIGGQPEVHGHLCGKRRNAKDAATGSYYYGVLTTSSKAIPRQRLTISVPYTHTF